MIKQMDEMEGMDNIDEMDRIDRMDRIAAMDRMAMWTIQAKRGGMWPGHLTFRHR